VDLVEAGVVTGHCKTRYRDRIVASYCVGTRRLYDFVDDNPGVQLLSIDQMCHPEEVARQSRMVSITQAFAIDLTGQVCVDQFEGELYGGVSTQVAFIFFIREGIVRHAGLEREEASSRQRLGVAPIRNVAHAERQRARDNGHDFRLRVGVWGKGIALRELESKHEQAFFPGVAIEYARFSPPAEQTAAPSPILHPAAQASCDRCLGLTRDRARRSSRKRGQHHFHAAPEPRSVSFRRTFDEVHRMIFW
jgi:Acetyl-CoA hydrolase/transferase C-terminal domain